MAINDTTTHSSTVRDAYNTGILGKESDASQKAPLGDILSVLLDVANTAVSVSAVTVGTAVTPTLTPTATSGATGIIPTATAVVTVSASSVSVATAVSTAAVAYASPDQTILANLANANYVSVNQCVTDIKALITKVNAAVVDISATDAKLSAVLVDLSAAKVDNTALAAQVNAALVDIKSLRACMAATAANGTMGGCTEPSLTVTSYLTGTLTYTPSSIISIHGYGTTPGVLKLIRDPNHTLSTGEVFWDGYRGLKFCAADLLTTYDAIYAKADSSQKVSCLMASIADIV